MKRKQVDVIWLVISIVSFFLMSFSFMLMPVETSSSFGEMSVVSYIAGIMFWLFLITGIVTQIVLFRRRQDWYVINRIRGNRICQKIGIISFFKNIYAIISDVVAVISLVGLIISLVATDGTGYICYVFISIFIFAFCMHCVLNGKNYYHVINQDVMLKNIEKERAKSKL